MTAAALTLGADNRLRVARNSARLFFLIVGLAAGSWGAIVPFAKTSLVLADSQLGLIMLAGGMGGLVAMPLGSALVLRVGSRVLAGIGASCAVVSLPAIMLAPSALALGGVLFLFGLTFGLLDISINAQAVIVEEQGGQAAMSSFHGFFSVGGLLAPLLIGALLEIGVGPEGCMLVVAGLVALIILTRVRGLYPSEFDSKAKKGTPFALPRGRTWLLGVICLIFYMAEGTMFDWTALFLRDYRSFDPAWAGLGLAGFSLAMTVIRLSGDRLVDRFGPVAIVRFGGCLAAAGLVLAVSVPSAYVGILGFTLFGIGAGNVVPIAFSAAGKVPGLPVALSIAALATLGNCGSIAGPAAVGFLSDAFGLPMALGLVATVVLAVAASARVVATEK